MTDRPADGSPGPESARILVVEDYAPLRVLLVRVLTAEGHRVAAVATASAAQARCGDEDFDLIVTDVQVLGGNGAEIARRVAARRPGQRVLFVSGTAGHDLDLDVPDARTDFLQKPFDIDVLVERVRHLLTCDVGPATPRTRRPGD